MRRILGICLGFGFLVASLSDLAANPLQQAYIQQDQQAIQFIQQQSGYSALDPEALINDAYYSSTVFLVDQASTAFLPDADLDALSRALLLFEHHEKPLPHARYLIQYSTETPVDFPQLQQSYIDITRYNLGAERRADLLLYAPAEQVAPVSEFGVGPHVSWRMVLGPVQGMQADLRYLSRKELSQSETLENRCLGQPCLRLESPAINESAQSMPPPTLASVRYQKQSDLGIARSALVAHELIQGVAPEPQDPLPYHTKQAQFILMLDMYVDGQEANSLGIVQQKIVLDDAVAEIEVIRQEVAGLPAQFFQSWVPR